MKKISIVIPAKNEADSLQELLPAIRRARPDAELIVVDDGSTDNTAAIAQLNKANLIRHPYSIGNGAAIKSGARAASGETIVFMDADGQHRAEDIGTLLHKHDEGYDLVVGARDRAAHASIGRWLANQVYNWLATWMTGHKVMDLTSGMRAVNAAKFRNYLSLLPNGFSYPTTSTMAFMRAGYSVAFEPIEVAQRADKHKSHIRPIRDGGRFLIIIFKVITLYAPLKIFAPASAVTFAVGCWYLAYTFISQGRFTNMTTLLFVTSILIFLIGLLSEQITTIIHMNVNEKESDRRPPEQASSNG